MNVALIQVYKGKLKTGETVAVKVQRPYVLETVTIDLYIIRRLGIFLKRFPQVRAVPAWSLGGIVDGVGKDRPTTPPCHALATTRRVCRGML